MTTPTPSSGPWRSRLSTTWYLVAAVVVALGVATAFRYPGPLVTLVLAGTTGLVVGGFTFAFSSSDLPSARRGARVGVWTVVATVVAIGLAVLLGIWSAVVLGGLLVSSPPLWTLVHRIRDHRRNPRRAGQNDEAVSAPDTGAGTEQADGRRTPAPETVGGVDMTDFEIALLDAEEEAGSTPASADAASPLGHVDLDELCRVWRRSSVLVRQRLDGPRLDVVLQTRQHCLDEMLRRDPVGTRAWMDAGLRLGDDPRPFLTQAPESI